MRLICCLVVLIAAYAAHSQDLPSKIRGYKVYKTNVVVRAADAPDAKDADLLVKLEALKITTIGLTGTTVEVAAEITSLDKSGKVDVLTFYDATVNGIAVDIDDQTNPFTFKKGVALRLSPATARFGPLNSARTAFRELIDSKTHWRLTGTVFVFGRFRRFGFTFKRVIPVRFDLTIPNPLRK